MSFDWIIAAVMAVLPLLAYRWGMRDGMQAKAGNAPEPLTLPKLHKAKPTAEEKYYDAILDNIERYNGTGEGQEEVDG